ncbi:MAG: HAD-IIIA family hydrolase [Gemmatimonadota bacterium]|nr:HAD-IIIA family hydrolase [Gemmatimonadota bacterium]
MLESLQAKQIRLVGLDVDGVLTDNGVYVGLVDNRPTEFKRFDIQDGIGVALLRHAGLKIVILSGRRSEATEVRAAELQVDACVQDDHARKLPAFENLLARFGVRWEDAAFVGDDLPDVPVLRRVGLPVAVANATPDAKAAARHVTTARGGHGAVREFVEEFLRARGHWERTVEAYLTERGERAARPSVAQSR